jgi:glycosyltransferase involved in cell wall biosynthesis
MRLDVLIPTFNRADRLGRTLDSLLAARVPPGLTVTITVVNNNCTDHTEATVAARTQRDDRVRQVFARVQGRSPALNAGITATTGDLVGMVDDDEEVDASWYEVIARAFADPDLDFIGGPYVPDWESPPPDWLPLECGSVVGAVDGGDKEVPFDAQFPGVLMGGNAVIRRRVIERIGLYAQNLGRVGHRLLSGEDREFYNRLLESGARGRYLPQLIIHHFIPAERCTKRYFRKWMFWHGVSMGVLSRQDKGTGPTHLRLEPWRFKQGAKALLTAVANTVGFRKEPSRAFRDEIFVWELVGMVYGATLYRP